MDTSASSIASVVADLRAGRVRAPNPGVKSVTDRRPENLKLLTDGPVVDATAIYRSLVAADKPVYLYEDHPCVAPPWESAMIGYQNEHGNVIVMTVAAGHFLNEHSQLPYSGRWETAEPVNWGDVRWTMAALLWLGGQSSTLGVFPTTGPVHMWRVAVYSDGRPADLHWIQLVEEYQMENWDMAHLTLLGTLNFVNCRNIELVEPKRPRAESRRIARTGVKVSTINVLPTGQSTKSANGNKSHGVPLTSVRGHFSSYGPEYGRGLLFGKLSGRFWIPQHARGSSECGESVNDYQLRTNTHK